MTEQAAGSSPFAVSWWTHLLGGWVHRWPRFWRGLGRLETSSLGEEVARRPVVAPLYVCGLARSGSTLLHEVLAAHPAVATHRVKDYPFVFTPCWWRRATTSRRHSEPRERAHGDRMLIHSDSPEALEEMLWMAFFPSCHDPAMSNCLGRDTAAPEFEAFYRAHIRKLLHVEGRSRYAAKANYHVARLPYLRRLFADARFLLPVREPASHIGSLMRQHARFSEAGRQHPRSVAYLRRAGHFEFGLDRRPINLGDTTKVKEVQDLWASGQEVRGWARYWALVHDYLADLLEKDAEVRAAALVVRYEDMCARPAETLGAVLAHAGLTDGEGIVQQFVPRISRPDYYDAGLTPEDRAIIAAETAAAARRWDSA